jgi:hypothetical protein
VSSYGLAAFGNGARAVSVAEELEEVDAEFGRDVLQERVDAQLVAKCPPYLLGLMAGTSGRSHESFESVVLDRQEVSSRLVAVLRG